MCELLTGIECDVVPPCVGVGTVTLYIATAFLKCRADRPTSFREELPLL